jgi:hypothetical protein
MNDELFSDLIEGMMELENMRLNSEQKDVADHVSALVSEGKQPNQAMAIALQKATQLRKDKGRQKAKQKGKHRRG